MLISECDVCGDPVVNGGCTGGCAQVNLVRSVRKHRKNRALRAEVARDPFQPTTPRSRMQHVKALRMLPNG